MNVETRLMEEAGRLPENDEADSTLDQAKGQIGAWANDAEADGQVFLAYTPDSLVPTNYEGAQYGEFKHLHLPAVKHIFWAFGTAEQRDQFVADVGATAVRDPQDA